MMIHLWFLTLETVYDSNDLPVLDPLKPKRLTACKRKLVRARVKATSSLQFMRRSRDTAPVVERAFYGGFLRRWLCTTPFGDSIS